VLPLGCIILWAAGPLGSKEKAAPSAASILAKAESARKAKAFGKVYAFADMVLQSDPGNAQARALLAEVERFVDGGGSLGAAAAVRTPGLSVSAPVFKAAAGGDVLAAGEAGTVSFDVSNATGSGPGLDLRARASSEAEVSFRGEARLGDLLPGRSRRVEIPLQGGWDLRDGRAAISVAFSEAGDHPPSAAKLEVETARLKKPLFRAARVEVVDQGSDDQAFPVVGDGNGALDPGELVEIDVVLANEGEGEARAARARLAGADGAFVRIWSGADAGELGDIAPGDSRRLRFSVSLAPNFKGPADLPLVLEAAEKRSRFDASLPLGVRVGSSLNAVGAGRMERKASVDELDVLPAYATPPRKNAFAVVIGVQDYPALGRAPHAGEDAAAVRNYLEEALGLPRENILALTGRAAARSDMDSAFDVWLRGRVQAAGHKSKAIVYFAGLGYTGPARSEPLLIPYDAAMGTLDQDGYPLKRIYEILADLPAVASLVVLDTSFSGAGPRTLTPPGGRARSQVLGTPAPETGPITVLFAASGREFAGVLDEKGHGVFTYYFLKGLRGEGGTEPGGAVMLKGVFGYLKAQVAGRARRDQRDQVPRLIPDWNLGVWLEEPLAVLR
jgi:hypothetical protein